MSDNKGVSIPKSIKDLVKRLRNYPYKYYFTDDELKKYGFKEKIEWPDKPIIFASKGEGILSVMAFGACIGSVNVYDDKWNGFDIEEVKSFADYLEPNKSDQDYYSNEHDAVFYLPERLLKVEAYKNNRKKNIEDLLFDKKGIANSAVALLNNSTYLDLMICAAYIRFMRRSKDRLYDVSERSMQSIISRINMDNEQKQDICWLDVEYKFEIIRDGKRKKPSVDFVVFDKNDESFGLIEFKYQGQSMDDGTKNSLYNHLIDFQIMTNEDTNRLKILNELFKYSRVLKELRIIDNKTFIKIENLQKQQSKGKLWCGFLFVDHKAKNTNRNHIPMIMEDRIIYDCCKQICEKKYKDKFTTEFLQNVRFQHIDFTGVNECKIQMNDKLCCIINSNINRINKKLSLNLDIQQYSIKCSH